MGITIGRVPEIGDSVEILPHREFGKIEDVVRLPFLSWWNQTLYYKVRLWSIPSKVKTYPFNRIKIVGYKREMLF